MRFVLMTAAVGMAIAALLIAPVVLMGASTAHADTGVTGYIRGIHSDAGDPAAGGTCSGLVSLRSND